MSMLKTVKSDISLLRFVSYRGVIVVFSMFLINAAIDLLMTAAMAASLARFIGNSNDVSSFQAITSLLGLEERLFQFTIAIIVVRFLVSMITTYALGSFTAYTGERIRAIIFDDFVLTHSSGSIEELIQNVQMNVAGYVNGRLKQWLTILRDAIIYMAIVLGASTIGGMEIGLFLLAVVFALLILRLITMNILAIIAKGTMDVSYRITRFLRTFFLLRQEIMIFRRNEWATSRFFLENRRMSSWAIKQDLMIAFTRLLLETGLFIGVMLGVVWATNQSIEGQGTLAKASLLVVMSMRLAPLLVSISQCYTALVSSAPRAYRLYETILNVDPKSLGPIKSPDRDEVLAQPTESGSVFFEGCEYANPAGRLITVPSFTIKPGEVVCLVGPSGIGKSSFVMDILGLSQRTDLPTEINKLSKILKGKKIGFCPQFPELMDDTYRENIFFGGSGESQEFQKLFKKFLIAGTPDDQINADNPSGGEKKKVGILRVLCSEKLEVAFFDEPSNALDVKSVDLFCSMVAQQMAGTAVMLVSHDPRVVECASKIIEIKDGG